MKKVLSGLLLLSTAAYAQHVHIWTKASQQTGLNNQVVCTWVCNGSGSQHVTTTVGYVTCPFPF